MIRAIRLTRAAFWIAVGIAIGQFNLGDWVWLLVALIASTAVTVDIHTLRAYAAGRRNGYQLASGTDPVLGEAHEFDAMSAPTVRIVGGSRKQWKKRDRHARLEVMR